MIERNILVLLLLLLGIGALFGGGVLIASPSGKLIGMPLTLLAHSSFPNFLIPGIILFLLLGLIPVTLAIALIQKPKSNLLTRFSVFSDMHWAWAFSVFIAFVLITWIELEQWFIQAVGWLHISYILYAIAIIFVALLPKVRSLYKK